jgi:hypothetical protein
MMARVVVMRRCGIGRSTQGHQQAQDQNRTHRICSNHPIRGRTVPARTAYGAAKGGGPGPVPRVRRGEDAITRCPSCAHGRT